MNTSASEQIFLERTAKVLPQFLLLEEQKKMMTYGLVFLVKTGPKNTRLEYNDPQLIRTNS